MRTEPYVLPRVEDIKSTSERLRPVVMETPLMPHWGSSQEFGCKVWLKREDLQVVRSYKIRGAYNKISSLPAELLENGVICASAGNHAQGVAFACHKLGIRGVIFMPNPTPQQKIDKVRQFGQEHVEIILHGDTFDDASRAATDYGREHHMAYIHPFDDEKVIEGQGTVGLEILQKATEPIDYLFLPIGGGGLAAGVSSLFKTLSPHTKIIGVEPTGAPAMQQSLERGEVVTLDQIDTFADGVAVRRVGEKTFEICRQLLDGLALVPEGKICQTMLQLYNQDAIVTEPAGALALAVLEQYRDEIKGKNVVCVISGGNNDIDRMAEIKERALLYQGLKHYFVVKFPQRAGALKEFVTHILGPEDDIVHFEYTKKTSRNKGPAVVGIELKRPDDFAPLVERMKAGNFFSEYLNERLDLFQYLV
ncbi:L-threonine ammonia-lyase [Catalinimonas alkaloidigena]|uniref:L-threonine dehydratase n=1 Tax=Catalinimonas alkaloidigena TaxID=1075417 RepID=A0A1G9LUV7_9BACT|nr:threonine ammonia-lyase IlvA [Catalinimonas alkaloidigena]SDL65872.1 L-threonine ammonia-lyase [Catalinimonas alkaloidigena]